MMELLQQMLQLQQQLNDATGGAGWENGMTNKGKPIDWKRCIYLEAAELVDSYPWKHWKNIAAQPDYENIKIEIVDIWHFVMSEALRIYKIESKGNIDRLAQTASELPAFNEFSKPEKNYKLNNYEQIEAVEQMVKILFCTNDIEKLINSFFEMSSKLNLKLPELYLLYIGKNILNKFRQEHGYKEGKYIKNWNGLEDNVVMQNILKENPSISPEILYQKLEEKYKDLS